MDQVNIFGLQLSTRIYAPVFFLLWAMIFFTVKRIGYGYIRRLIKKTKTPMDDLFLNSADFPLTLLIFASGATIVEKMLPVTTDGNLTTYFVVGFKAITIVAIILFIERNSLFFKGRCFKNLWRHCTGNCYFLSHPCYQL